MSTRPHTPMAYRLSEDTGVKHLPMRRSGRRQALGLLLGGLFLLGLGAPHPVQAREKVPKPRRNRPPSRTPSACLLPERRIGRCLTPVSSPNR